MQLLIGVLLVKSIIWSVSLGSGTSGGVLAPLLMMGGALGGLASLFLPNLGPGFWPLVSMGAILGGTMRSPFTGIIFLLELTHDVNMLVPLLIAVVIAHAFTVLVMRRSILTEKVSRRGYHLSREYATDPLELIFVREVMRTTIVALPDMLAPGDLASILQGNGRNQIDRLQHLYPVLGAEGTLQGVVTRQDLLRLQRELEEPLDGFQPPPNAVSATATTDQAAGDGDRRGRSRSSSTRQDISLQALHVDPVVAYPDEPLRAVIYRMAETGYTRFPVVERSDPTKLVGMISLSDLLKATERNLEEERDRERILRLRVLFRLRNKPRANKEKIKKLSLPPSESH